MRLWEKFPMLSAYLVLIVLAAVLAAPLSDSEEDPDSLGPALEAVSRARREARKATRNSPSTRGLIRYRYPVHLKKRSQLDADDILDAQEDMDDDDDDDDSEILKLSKDLALRLLLESAQREEDEDDKRKRSMTTARRNLIDIDNRKKVRPGRPEYNDELPEKKRRLYDLLQELDDDDDEEEPQTDDTIDDDEDQEQLFKALLQIMAEEGIDENDLEDILRELDDDDEDDEPLKEERHRGMRNKYLGSGRPYWHDKEFDQENEVDKRWRGGSSKREQFPWMPNTIKKRSIPTEDQTRSAATKEAVQFLTVAENSVSNHSEPTQQHANNNKSHSTTTTTLKTNSIRKKSVDWDDYFGYDKRKRNVDEENINQDMRDWLEAEYYKMIAGSLASKKKRGDHSSAHLMEMKRKRKSVARHLDWDDFPEKRKRWNASGSWDKRRRSLVDDNPIATQPEIREQQDETDAARRLIDLASGKPASNLRETVLEAIRRRQPHVLAYLQAIDDEEDDYGPPRGTEDPEDDDDDSYLIKKKRQEHDDKRKKRLSKRRPHAGKLRAHQRDAPEDDDDADEDVDECPVMSRITTTCNAAVHLMGGYRQLLSEACARYEACSACTDEEGLCDRDYHRQTLSLCGHDLLCRSQSERLVSALRDIHQVVDNLNDDDDDADAGKEEQLCQADPCLLRLWKRR